MDLADSAVPDICGSNILRHCIFVLRSKEKSLLRGRPVALDQIAAIHYPRRVLDGAVVGLVDMLISFLRVEGFLAYFGWRRT